MLGKPVMLVKCAATHHITNQPAEIKGLFPLRIDTYRKAALEDLVPRLEEIDTQYQVSVNSTALSVGANSLLHPLY